MSWGQETEEVKSLRHRVEKEVEKGSSWLDRSDFTDGALQWLSAEGIKFEPLDLDEKYVSFRFQPTSAWIQEQAAKLKEMKEHARAKKVAQHVAELRELIVEAGEKQSPWIVAGPLVCDEAWAQLEAEGLQFKFHDGWKQHVTFSLP